MIQTNLIDLHIHTNHSDGLFSPEKVVEVANRLKLKAIAITDHDTTSAVVETIHCAKKYGIEVVPGIEISSTWNKRELHILGYFVDPYNSEINEYSKLFLAERKIRAQKIVQRLNELGINITYDVVKKKAGDGAVGRPHVAETMIEEGYVYSYHEAFEKYLGFEKAAYVPKIKISPERAINMIKNAGGIPFLAHPGVGIEEEIIFKLLTAGLCGLETIHPNHSPAQTDYYNQFVEKHNILRSGGSDCHGARQGDIMMGVLAIPYDYLQKIKEYRTKQNATVRFSV